MPKKEFCKRGHLMSETRAYNKAGEGFCRLCRNITAVELRKRNITKFRTYDKIAQIKKTYGITKEDYENLIKKSNNQCMICGSPPLKKKLSIDHCHSTKKVRGLLCHYCNMALGLFKDNTDIMQKAIEYLKIHK